MDILFYIAATIGLGLAAVALWIFCVLVVLGLMRFQAWSNRVQRNITRNARRIA